MTILQIKKIRRCYYVEFSVCGLNERSENMDIYYNPKIDYLFAKYLYSKPVIIEDEQEWKDVYDRIVEPSTIRNYCICKR